MKLSNILARLKPSSKGKDSFQYRKTDVFLVSYPRSGNTWLRFIIANLQNDNSAEPIDFHTVHHFVPDIEMESGRALARNMKGPRILKTHGRHDPRIRKAVYLLRDGRDVMVSYYHYLLGQGRIYSTFLEFLKTGPAYPCQWQEHVTSWLGNRKKRTEILLVRYEDLLHDAFGQTKKVAEFLGLSQDDHCIQEAISKSTFARMSQMEREKGRAHHDSTKGFRFIRKGISGDWRNYFEERHKKVFKNQANDVLIRFGYAVDRDW
ncbi:MAG: sulfotransferase domain-containing protein [Deltaproteobacteria bacterium]|nr:sulfotransferase domain-containing protein [Deltaproteobacteria bacterium]MBW2009248.1 sulfotransferase domain-containing protein [Deltaproteobacteria bacterium]